MPVRGAGGWGGMVTARTERASAPKAADLSILWHFMLGSMVYLVLEQNCQVITAVPSPSLGGVVLMLVNIILLSEILLKNKFMHVGLCCMWLNPIQKIKYQEINNTQISFILSK